MVAIHEVDAVVPVVQLVASGAKLSGIDVEAVDAELAKVGRVRGELGDAPDEVFVLA